MATPTTEAAISLLAGSSEAELVKEVIAAGDPAAARTVMRRLQRSAPQPSQADDAAGDLALVRRDVMERMNKCGLTAEYIFYCMSYRRGTEQLARALKRAAASEEGGDTLAGERVRQRVASQLRESMLAAEGAASDALPVAPLRDFDLGRNPLGDTGAEGVAALLHFSRTLTALRLPHAGIGDKGAATLASALSVTAAPVRELDLDGNAIGNDGGAAIARSLSFCTCLSTLTLERNPMAPALQALLTACARARRAPDDALCRAAVELGSLGARKHAAAVAGHPSAAQTGEALHSAAFAAPGGLPLPALQRLRRLVSGRLTQAALAAIDELVDPLPHHAAAAVCSAVAVAALSVRRSRLRAAPHRERTAAPWQIYEHPQTVRDCFVNLWCGANWPKQESGKKARMKMLMRANHAWHEMGPVEKRGCVDSQLPELLRSEGGPPSWVLNIMRSDLRRKGHLIPPGCPSPTASVPPRSAPHAASPQKGPSFCSSPFSATSSSVEHREAGLGAEVAEAGAAEAKAEAAAKEEGAQVHADVQSPSAMHRPDAHSGGDDGDTMLLRVPSGAFRQPIETTETEEPDQVTVDVPEIDPDELPPAVDWEVGGDSVRMQVLVSGTGHSTLEYFVNGRARGSVCYVWFDSVSSLYFPEKAGPVLTGNQSSLLNCRGVRLPDDGPAQIPMLLSRIRGLARLAGVAHTIPSRMNVQQRRRRQEPPGESRPRVAAAAGALVPAQPALRHGVGTRAAAALRAGAADPGCMVEAPKPQWCLPHGDGEFVAIPARHADALRVLAATRPKLRWMGDVEMLAAESTADGRTLTTWEPRVAAVGTAVLFVYTTCGALDRTVVVAELEQVTVASFEHGGLCCSFRLPQRVAAQGGAPARPEYDLVVGVAQDELRRLLVALQATCEEQGAELPLTFAGHGMSTPEAGTIRVHRPAGWVLHCWQPGPTGDSLRGYAVAEGLQHLEPIRCGHIRTALPRLQRSMLGSDVWYCFDDVGVRGRLSAPGLWKAEKPQWLPREAVCYYWAYPAESASEPMPPEVAAFAGGGGLLFLDPAGAVLAACACGYDAEEAIDISFGRGQAWRTAPVPQPRWIRERRPEMRRRGVRFVAALPAGPAALPGAEKGGLAFLYRHPDDSPHPLDCYFAVGAAASMQTGPPPSALGWVSPAAAPTTIGPFSLRRADVSMTLLSATHVQVALQGSLLPFVAAGVGDAAMLSEPMPARLSPVPTELLRGVKVTTQSTFVWVHPLDGADPAAAPSAEAWFVSGGGFVFIEAGRVLAAFALCPSDGGSAGLVSFAAPVEWRGDSQQLRFSPAPPGPLRASGVRYVGWLEPGETAPRGGLVHLYRDPDDPARSEDSLHAVL
eukprot:TRINITY_DN43736_c0_g1_i1.p1 TRINITY_DN43736_c0_g1~~TRINITY_DN43736_c0_g1_i1.p1  ORF type:complete len:1482 (+),score=398.89 TRINITY_DN43736_c0_g1_i1:377-4447(+)